MVVQVAELEWGDYITIAVYFVVVLVVGMWVRNLGTIIIVLNHFIKM